MTYKKLHLSAEVEMAIKNNIPIVALESTIIAHGMPYPQNLETASHLENIIREKGCCPATIFLRDGNIMIGAEQEQLQHLAQAKDVQKATTRDIAAILVKNQTGATTVAATMRCCRLAGIKVFATGGIGGVHRGAEETFDISADLTELANTPVIVISAGAKAILDIGKTLEYLETAGVAVMGWQTDTFPGFYSAATPWSISRIDSAAAIAAIYKEQIELGLSSGMLIANPVPQEYEIPWNKMALIIDQALADMKAMEITGKAVTPFLLSRITEITGGDSLKTNIRLVENNVKLACRIARRLHE
ncbi:MAG: pseudouridine-5'-phosphate glycosidase [Candidatus Cloacimonetes bacterium]|nr:pseudouridine-5'-phosphate glycosidase [Candidatus Cloacimonadota bacterium]